MYDYGFILYMCFLMKIVIYTVLLILIATGLLEKFKINRHMMTKNHIRLLITVRCGKIFINCYSLHIWKHLLSLKIKYLTVFIKIGRIVISRTNFTHT